MERYKLINKQTGEEHLCDKVTVDGFDYYVSEEHPNLSQLCYSIRGVIGKFGEFENCYLTECFKIIATTNPSIDLPKVVDEVDRYRNKYFETTSFGSVNPIGYYKAYESGYNKSQETHPFSEEDMIEFEKFCSHTDYKNGFGRVDRKELLQLWREQKPKIVWYE